MAVTVGQDVDAWCKKCELILAHVVVVLKGTRAGKVECKTCKELHAYRKSVPGPRKPKEKGPPKPNDYEVAMEGREASSAIGYELSGVYKKEDLLDHKKFGIGFVQRLVDAKTMEVLFPEGPKLLVYGR